MKLSEACSIISGYAFKSVDFNETGCSVLKIANIKSLAIDLSNCQKVNIDNTEKMFKFTVKQNDVLIAMTGQGSVGKVGIIRNSINEPVYINQRVGKFVCDENKLNNIFLYYLLSSDKYYQLLFELGTGTGQPNLSPNQILSIEIPDIPYVYQKKIGVYLSNLDEKILNNLNYISILNDIIFNIYKRVTNNFIEQKTKGNPLDNGSEFTVFDVVKEIKKKNKEEKDYPVLSVVKEGEFKASEDVFAKQVYSKSTKNYKIVRRNQVAYNPARANIGSIAMLKEYDVGLVSPIYTVFEMKDTITPTFFYYYMKQPIFQEMIKHHAIGTTRQNFPFEAFKMFPMVVPPMELQLKFEEIAKPIEQKIAKLKEENEVLAEIRDTLLPKLMSGKLPVEVGEE